MTEGLVGIVYVYINLFIL